jgi:hypothetical protein
LIYWIKYGTQSDIRFPMVKRGVVDLAVSADWTPAAADSAISKDGGNLADTTNTVAVVSSGTATRSGVDWKLTISATEAQAAEINIQIVDAATKAVEDQFLTVYTYGNASAKFAGDWSDIVRLGLTGLANATPGAAGGLFIAGTNAATTVTTALTTTFTGNLTGSVASVTGAVGSVTGAVGSVTGLTAATVHSDLDDIQARLPAALTSDGNIKADTLRVNGSALAAARMQRAGASMVLGTCAALGTTTSVIASALAPTSAVNDQFNGRIIIFADDTTTTALRGQATDITDYVHATLTFTVTALTTAPQSGDTFVVV